MLAQKEGIDPTFSGIEDAIKEKQTDIRIFGKPSTRPYRRMAVTLAYDKIGSDVHKVKERAIANAKKVKVITK